MHERCCNISPFPLLLDRLRGLRWKEILGEVVDCCEGDEASCDDCLIATGVSRHLDRSTGPVSLSNGNVAEYSLDCPDQFQ